MLRDFRDRASESSRRSFLDRHDYLWGVVGACVLLALVVLALW